MEGGWGWGARGVMLAHGIIYPIKRHVGGFLRVFRFPPPIKLTDTI